MICYAYPMEQKVLYQIVVGSQIKSAKYLPKKNYCVSTVQALKK